MVRSKTQRKLDRLFEYHVRLTELRRNGELQGKIKEKLKLKARSLHVSIWTYWKVYSGKLRRKIQLLLEKKEACAIMESERSVAPEKRIEKISEDDVDLLLQEYDQEQSRMIKSLSKRIGGPNTAED